MTARRMHRLLDRLALFRTRAVLAWPLLAGNLVAVWYGWTDYYAGQLADTPWPLRIFVPDSPNAVLAFAAVLLLARAQRRSAALDLLAWVTNVKVGLWTAFVLLYYFDGFFATHARLQWTLFWLHLGMVAQAFVLHRHLRRHPPPLAGFAAVAAWVGAGDLLDYWPGLAPCHPRLGGGLHPCLPGPAWPVVTLVTFGLTLATLAVAALLYGWGRKRYEPRPL